MLLSTAWRIGKDVDAFEDDATVANFPAWNAIFFFEQKSRSHVFNSMAKQ